MLLHRGTSIILKNCCLLEIKDKFCMPHLIVSSQFAHINLARLLSIFCCVLSIVNSYHLLDLALLLLVLFIPSCNRFSLVTIISLG